MTPAGASPGFHTLFIEGERLFRLATLFAADELINPAPKAREIQKHYEKCD